ncbi:MAG: hypothetical protein M0Q91_08810 [Methanoregula sp.]|jgi:hypothetical protein|nr:hypothetical protein [Methanoregula sp.]
MRSEHLASILADSVEAGRGGRAKNLKVYVRFFLPGIISFEDSVRQKQADARSNEYFLSCEGYDFFFDEWPWGIVVYHALEEMGTKKVESFLETHSNLKRPWITKNEFNLLKQEFEDEGSKIILERAIFTPFEDYSGFGLKVEVSGSRTQEVINELNEKYAIHPMRLGIEMGSSEELSKFEMTNTGRLSFSSGPVDSIFLIISKYVQYIIKSDEMFDFAQSRKIQIDGISVRENREVVNLKLPSLEKIKSGRIKRNEAIIKMFIKNQETFGYVGIPIGPDRINVLDLAERKMLQITIDDDEIYIYSENPSQVQSALRRLVSKIATNIDPDVTLEKIKIGTH